MGYSSLDDYHFLLITLYYCYYYYYFIVQYKYCFLYKVETPAPTKTSRLPRRRAKQFPKPSDPSESLGLGHTVDPVAPLLESWKKVRERGGSMVAHTENADINPGTGIMQATYSKVNRLYSGPARNAVLSLQTTTLTPH
jgi:hypothetical protein